MKLTCDLDHKLRSVVSPSRHVFDLPECQQAVNDLAEHDMLSVQELALCCGYEEL